MFQTLQIITLVLASLAFSIYLAKQLFCLWMNYPRIKVQVHRRKYPTSARICQKETPLVKGKHDHVISEEVVAAARTAANYGLGDLERSVTLQARKHNVYVGAKTGVHGQH